METLNIASTSQVSEMEANELPYLQITEQPIDNFRFRYKSEMHGTHGCLTGITATKQKKRFPSVELINFHGDAVIRCSLFQVNTLDLLHHSHSLVVRKDNDVKDPHEVIVSPTKGYGAIFKGMGIMQTAKKDIVNELREKLVKRMAFEKGRDVTERERQQLRAKAEEDAKSMELNKVCLCFEAFQLVDDNWVSICEPVLSNPINNMKSVRTGELKITRLSTNISEASGNEEVFLFVEKVDKKDIKVRFFKVDEKDDVIWEDWGRFSEVDVHRQYAIALRTPPYSDQEIEENVQCYMQLVRPSDNCSSDVKEFRYKPRRAVFSRKRARVNVPSMDIQLETINTFVQHLRSDYIPEQLDTLMESAPELVELKEITKDLNDLLPVSQLTTDSVAVPNTEVSSTQLCPEMMHKIIVRNFIGLAAEEIRSLFKCEYDDGRFIIDFLVTYNPAIFKYFLTIVEKLGLVDLLEYQNDRKKSCFHIVCENCPPETIFDIVPILIRLGADPNKTDDKGDTVLHVLIREDKLTKCADLFIKANYPNARQLNLEIENDDSLTPLLLAVRLNRIEIVDSLLLAGALIDRVYKKDGNSILHIAVSENAEDLVSLILKRTAIDVTRKNDANQMPIELATAAVPPNWKILDMLKTKYDQFVTNKYLIAIKPEPIDDYAASVKIKDDSHDDSFDDVCLDQLCLWFNRCDRWKKLARCMDLEAFVNVWASSKNPSKMLFKFSEIQGTGAEKITGIISKQLNESKALVYIDEMIARKLEDGDYELV